MDEASVRVTRAAIFRLFAFPFAATSPPSTPPLPLILHTTAPILPPSLPSPRCSNLTPIRYPNKIRMPEISEFRVEVFSGCDEEGHEVVPGEVDDDCVAWGDEAGCGPHFFFGCNLRLCQVNESLCLNPIVSCRGMSTYAYSKEQQQLIGVRSHPRIFNAIFIPLAVACFRRTPLVHQNFVSLPTGGYIILLFL